MTEIEQIKQALKDLTDSGVSNLNTATITFLLTTIESQKEEIEKQRSRSTEFLNSKIDTANAKHMLDTKNKQLQTENESQKAITELAVKGLIEIKDRCNTAGAYTNDAYIHLIAHKALGEIKRLTHEN